MGEKVILGMCWFQDLLWTNKSESYKIRVTNDYADPRVILAVKTAQGSAVLPAGLGVEEVS